MHSALIQNRLCRALALYARNVAIWTKSGEKIYRVGHTAEKFPSLAVAIQGERSKACQRCGRTGHVTKNCFFLSKYASGTGLRVRQFCGKRGHLADKCFISLWVRKCGFTHDSRAEIRIFTPRDIKFRTIFVMYCLNFVSLLRHIWTFVGYLFSQVSIKGSE